MRQISHEVTNRIHRYILADLHPTPIRVFSRVGLAVAIGGVLSLFLCGQFGIGGTTFAINLNHYFHSNHHTLFGSLALMPYKELICPLICGALFAIVPTAVLRLCSNQHLFRVILTQHFYAVVTWVAAFGAILGLHGDFGNQLLAVTAWVIAATTAFALLGFGLSSADKWHKVPRAAIR